MTPRVICFSGRIGSGKTTVSVNVAEVLNWPRASFGDYVRSIASKRGLDPTDREALANLGESLINSYGWDQFCQCVLATVSWDNNIGLIVDGVRHVAAYETIQRLVFPTPVFLVYLDLLAGDPAVGRQAGKGMAPSGATELHSTEREVTRQLPSYAHLVLSAEQSVDRLTEQVVDFLASAENADH